MKRSIKHLTLASILGAVFAAAPAQAHEDRSCFSQKNVSGWIKVCSEKDGGFALNLGSYGDRRDHHRDLPDLRAVPVAYYYPAPAYYFVPPGHYKHHDKHHRHDRHSHRNRKDRH